MAKAVYGLVRNVPTASRIINDLKTLGYSNNQVSVVMPENHGPESFALENNSKAPEGATVGGGTGMLLGGALGWLAGIGALAIPGVGPLIAAGPIIGALTGAAVGGASGGVAGGLIGLGMSEYEAKLYEKRIKEENQILVSAHVEMEDQVDRVQQIFKGAGAEDIHTSSVASVAG